MDKPFILYENLFAAGTITATGTGTGYNAAHIADLRGYTFWQSAAAGTNYLTFTLANAGMFDTLAICSHNLGTIGATLSLEAYISGTWVEIIAPFVATTNGIIVKTLAAVTTTLQGRLKIVTASLLPQIATVMIGRRLVFPEYLDANFTPFGQTITADSFDSKTGNLLGASIKFFPWKATAKFSDLSGPWVTGDYRQFWDNHGRHLRPFIWVPALDEAPDLLFVARMQTSAQYAPVYKNGWDIVDKLDFPMEGVDVGSPPITNLSLAASFSRSGVAYQENGAQVATGVPRYEAGPNGKLAFMVEEGTTNLLTANQSSLETDLTGWSNNLPASTIITRDTTEYFHGVACLKIVTQGSSSAEGAYASFDATSGQTYTFSTKIKGVGYCDLVIYESAGNKDVQAITLTDEWTPYDVTLTATATGTIYIYICGYNRLVDFIAYADCLQVEAKPYATTWVVGGSSRNAETCTIPVAGILHAAAGSIECQANPLNPSYVVGQRNQVLLGYYDGANNYFYLLPNTDGCWTLNGPGGLLITGPLASYESQRIAIVWENNTTTLYVDGVAAGSSPYLPVWPTDTLGIGYERHTNNANQFNGRIGNLRISSRARTAAEIAAASQSTTPPTIDRDTTVLLTFDGTLTGTIQGLQP